MAKYRATRYVKNRPRSGRPKKTTPREDRFLVSNALRNRRLSATILQDRFRVRFRRDFSVQTIRNRLHAVNLQARMAARKPTMTALHQVHLLCWCRQHRPWNLRSWRNVVFSDESRFCLLDLDVRVKVWRRPGERYVDCCIDRVTSFVGGSVMVWGGTSMLGKTRLVVVAGNLKGTKYRDDILQPIALPYLQTLGPNAIFQDDNALPLEPVD